MSGRQLGGPTCRICLNSSFESDASRLNRKDIVSTGNAPNSLSTESLSQLLSPCQCSGSCGRLHLGCLLLEVQFRRSATCQLCRTPYRGVAIHRTGGGGNFHRMVAYLSAHFLRCLATLVLALSVPLLTTVWFCNRIKFCSLQNEERAFGGGGERFGNGSYRVVATTSGRGKGTGSHHLVRQPVHPLLVLIFTYHADVLWINVVNLMLIQLILHNLEHYQQWAVEHRPRVAIHLTAQ
ncbi:hypothetical protein TYRP_006930 [Tyrophagus putrescentiae]|nr:hypothetical protein TYRP_006930 [Tyrophagus putrescentiae]